MTDLEPQLRDLLRQKAGEAPPLAPGAGGAAEAWGAGVRLRSRRRRQTLGGCVGVAAVLAAIAVLALGRGGSNAVPTASGPCFRPPSITPAAPAAANNWSPITLAPGSQCFELTADSQASNGVSPDTSFTLTSTVRTDTATLTPLLTVQPTVPLSVEAVGTTGRKFHIQPTQSLAATTLYRFAILNRPGGQAVQTWSFQAGAPLTIAASIPGSHATNVPLNIGIQLSFNVDGVTGAQQRFAISPQVTGTFQTQGRRLSFVPSSPLQPSTVYTVTVTAGVSVAGTSETLANDFVLQFETGTKTPGGSAGMSFVNTLWGSPPTAAPTFSFVNFPSFITKQPAPPTSTTLSVYRFSGLDAFLGSLGTVYARPPWASLTPANYPSVTTTGLSEVEQVTAPLQPDKSVLDARLPAPLPAGYYLVTAPTGATGGLSPIAYSWLQVSDLSAYVTESTTKTLVWVNDLQTGKSVAGVSVQLAGGKAVLATTGPDGTAAFSSSVFHSIANPATGIVAPQELVLSGPGGTQATVQVPNSPEQRDSTGEPTAFGYSDATAAYWQFLTTDRPLYRLSDTIQVWGVLRLRNQLDAPQKVTLILTGGLYGSSPVTLAQASVMTGPDGTYEGALSYQQADPGYYSVEALVGGQVISNTPIQILDFVTPPYSLTVTSSRRVVVAGDPVTYTVQASFFDGSPVPNLVLTASFGGATTPYPLTTNPAGAATLVAVPPIAANSLVVTPTIPEQADISGSSNVEVLPAAVTTQLQATREPSSIVVSGTVYAVDLAKANAPGASQADEQGSPIRDQPVTVLVTGTTTTFVQTGQIYNALQNTTAPKFTPVTKTVTQSVHAVTDAHGAIHVSVPAPSSAPAYTVVLDVADPAGRHHDQTATPFAAQPPPGLPVFGLSPSGPFGLGQQVQAVAVPGNLVTGTASPGTPFLFTVARSGLLAHSVQSSGLYAFRFASADVPNASVDAVYFNGSTYVDLGTRTATFDTESKALDVSVAPARRGYQPGDKATLDVQVSQGGKPVQAQMLISVVDNAIFSIDGGLTTNSDILGRLYTPVPSGIIATFSTPTGASQQSSSGPALPVTSGPTLTNIRDDADFTQVATGPDGKASVSFTLPDNLTSWRVQALAVTGDLSAGSATTLVPVSLPLFVNPTLNTSYLASDTATARVAAYGDSLKVGEPVTFTVDTPGLAAAPVVENGTAFTPVDIALPPLTAGTHSLTFRVSAGGRSEAIVKTISVVGSRLTSTSAQYSQLGAGESWTPPATTADTDVTVSDASRGGWYPELLSLSFAAGNRSDQLLAASEADTLLAKFFGASSAGSSPSLSAYVESGGGVGILPYGSNDEVASAEAAALNPPSINRSDLLAYFQSLLAANTTTAEQAAIALYGEAALGQPVLSWIQAAAGSGTLDPTARLYAGLAAAELGDMDLARSLYRGLLQQYGQAEGAMNRLEVDAVPDDVYTASALAAELGAYLGDSHAAGFEFYVDANPSTTLTVVAEQALFLSQLLPQLPAGDAQVSYNLDGSTATTSLAGESVTLHLSPSQLQGLNLHADHGTVAVTVAQQVPTTPATAKVDPSLSLARSYSATNVAVGDVVTVTMTYQLGATALAGCYQMTDLLPSGFKVLVGTYQLGSDGPMLTTPYAIVGQAVSFCAEKGTAGTGSISYQALAVEPGTYLAEPATLQSQSAQQSLAFSSSTTVTIH